MSTTTPQTRTLKRALDMYGGEAALAKALGVPMEALSAWLAGDSVPTADYMRALDLVASGQRQ